MSAHRADGIQAGRNLRGIFAWVFARRRTLGAHAAVWEGPSNVRILPPECPLCDNDEPGDCTCDEYCGASERCEGDN